MSAFYPYERRGLKGAFAAVRESASVLRLLWPLALVAAVFGVSLAAVAVTADRAGGSGEAQPSAYGGALAPNASAIIGSEPLGAVVFLDGDSVGVTPLRLADLTPGPVRVTLWLDGFVRADTLVRLGAGEGARVHLRLAAAAPLPEAVASGPLGPADGEPAPSGAETSDLEAPPAPPTAARIEVVVRPWGTVSVDGVVRHRDADVLVSEEVLPGIRRVRVSHPTLGDLEQPLRVAPGQTVQVVFDLNAGTVVGGRP